MVKGISRQVIVVHSPDPKLFEQAIFILKDDAVGGEGVSDEALLKEAKHLIRGHGTERKRRFRLPGAAWFGTGAALTGLAWLLTSLL